MGAKSKLTIEDLLMMFPDPVSTLAEELRPIVRTSMPTATEVAYSGWRAIGYRDKFAGYVCGIFLFEDHVRLIFEHGHLLADPGSMLEGATKQTRHITLRPGRPIPARAIRDYVNAAVALGAALSTPR